MIAGGETREELIAIIDKQRKKIERGARDLDNFANLLAEWNCNTEHVRHRVLEAADRLRGGVR